MKITSVRYGKFVKDKKVLSMITEIKEVILTDKKLYKYEKILINKGINLISMRILYID